MAECLDYTVVADGGSDIIGGALDLIGSLPESHAYSGMPQHPDVITAVAKSHGLVKSDTEVLYHSVDSHTFIAPLRHYVGKPVAPAYGLTVMKRMAEQTAFFYLLA